MGFRNALENINVRMTKTHPSNEHTEPIRSMMLIASSWPDVKSPAISSNLLSRLGGRMWPGLINVGTLRLCKGSDESPSRNNRQSQAILYILFCNSRSLIPGRTV